MARFSSAFRTAGAGSTTLPIAGLMAIATVRPRIAEIGIFNTTATAVALALRRVTAIGTPGSTQSIVFETDDVQTALALPKDTWTVAPTFVTGNVRVASLGAAIGSGVIWTFSTGPELIVPPGTGNGIVIVPLTGTGQVCDVSVTWDE